MPSAKTKASKRRYGEDSDDSEEIIQPPPKKVGTINFILRLQIIDWIRCVCTHTRQRSLKLKYY